MDPRISFSYGFADVQQQTTSIKQDAILREAAAAAAAAAASASASSDFEFRTVPLAGFSISSCAEELFCEGKILPSKKSNLSSKISTLRDELLVDDEDGLGDARGRKGSMRWKERFGFRKSRNQSKNDTNIGFCNTAC